MCGGRATAAAAAAVAAAAPPWQGAGVHRQRAPQVAHTSDYTIKHFELVSPQGRGLDGPGGTGDLLDLLSRGHRIKMEMMSSFWLMVHGNIIQFVLVETHVFCRSQRGKDFYWKNYIRRWMWN